VALVGEKVIGVGANENKKSLTFNPSVYRTLAKVTFARVLLTSVNIKIKLYSIVEGTPPNKFWGIRPYFGSGVVLVMANR
jgi:hypothetical protein